MKFNTIKKITIIIMLILLFFPATTYVNADSPMNPGTGVGTGSGTGNTSMSSKEAGQKVANFAVSFVTNHASECVYDVSDDAYNHCLKKNAEGKAYKRVAKDANGNGKIDENEMFVPMDYTGKLVYSARYNNKYPFDCTGFVSFLYNQTLGILSANNMVTTGAGNSGGGNFDILNAGIELQPGDILRKPCDAGGSGGHVVLYVGLGGNRDIVEAASVKNGIRFSSIPQYSQVLRLKDGNEYEESEGGIGETLPGDEELADSDQTLEGGVNQYIDPYDPKVTIPDQDSFEFKGTGKKNFIGMGDRIEDLKAAAEAVVDFLKSGFTWILGIMLYPIKMVLIGWIQLGQELLSGILTVATGTQIDNINLEDIIFNKIQLLDVNIFTNTPGGTAIASGSVVDVIRNGIAEWYNIFRKVSIIGMLITLLYLGIRIALNSIPETKAKYKEMLIGWLFGFAIVFFIHYFILIVITLNESLMQVIPHDTELGTTIYEEIEIGMYQVDFIKALTHILVFLVLFIYTIKFFYIYLKRLFVVLILIMIAPLMGITYAIDRINGNKTSKHLTTWIQEFSINVLIQFVHAIIYVVFVSSVLEIIEQTGNVASIIVVCIILHFILEAEVLVKKMFKMNKAGSLKDILQSTKGLQTAANAVFAGAVAKKIGSMYVSGAKKLGKGLKNSWNDLTHSGWGYQAKPEDTNTNQRTLTDIDEKIKEAKEKKDESAYKIAKELQNFTLNATVGGIQTVMGIPMMVISPSLGLATAVKGVERLRKAYGSGSKIKYKKHNITGPRRGIINKTYNFVRGKFSLDFYRGIAPNALTEAYSDYKNSPEKIKNMEEAKEIEIQLALHLEDLKDKDLIVNLPKTNMFGEEIGGDKNITEEQRKATKEFNKAIKTLIEGTSKKNVKKAVSKYFLSNRVDKLNLKNVDDIAQELEHIKVTEEFGANFKQTLKLEIMNASLSSNQLSKDKTRIEIDKNLQKEIKEEASRARKHYKEIKPNDITKEESKRLENEHIYEALDKKIDDDVMNKVMEKMSVEDLTRVMHKTLLQKDCIQKVNTRPEFTPVLEKLQELNTLNEETKYNTGDSIYNIDDLVKQMKQELTREHIFER